MQSPATTTRPHAVLRAICMAGERCEVGSVVHLTRDQALELARAGKVTAEPVPPAAAERPAAGPAPAAADAAPADAKPARKRAQA